MASKHEARRRLRGILATYRAAAGDGLDEHGCAVLDRLSAGDDAAKAFDEFGIDDGAATRIVTGCIEADILVRTFTEKLVAERAMLERLDRLDKAVGDLQIFVAEPEAGPTDRLGAVISHHRDSITDQKRGLYLISGDIAARRGIAYETMPRLGATKKTRDGADTAAIGWLAARVRAC
jgi:hypothetical protein